MTPRVLRPAALAAALLVGCATPSAPVAPQRSGFDDMSPALQAMQRDDTANPAMLSVQEGEQLWKRGDKSCANCHGDITRMKGVAARYPVFDELLKRPVNLSTRINLCRERHQGQAPLPFEHADLLALEAAVAMQSRGMPIAPSSDVRMVPFRERGAVFFSRRIGQLNLSCAQCHDQLVGGKLAGSVIPQGQATGYPVYRLEWQAMGSLGRRLRGCMTGVRAEPLAWGSIEMAELEVYLAARAMGMPVESPGLRP
ncbi:sulfur oxidation c-type cytochrome SoxA [Ramlibacter albus]|uniref:SoxAX cytochrome complex subunit A n=1 Tax=Ramlibacter albus TaxID=2079448 RepID=A0A923MCG9_9BURK|nr:sulfur oxidation c-type cytochrome SoxA [Ramlibacter albus]MBC5766517.1 sulfur oxidation c-type cytochrome SoxA [Ramlibacter albus]